MEKKMSESLRSRLLSPRALFEREDEGPLMQKVTRMRGEKVVDALQKNGFHAYYAETKEDAAEQLFQLIPPDSTVSYGDSHTVFALDVEDRLKNEKNCDIILFSIALTENAMKAPGPTDKIIGTPEEMKELLMRYLASDVFLLGANAISLDGQIVNVDARGNRVVGGIYGPNRIIVVASVNKVAKDLNAALDRVRYEAAQTNITKYNFDTPCMKLGKCADCKSADRPCKVTTIIHRCPKGADYHVIIVGDKLGF